jgi:hypothetical protein
VKAVQPGAVEVAGVRQDRGGGADGGDHRQHLVQRRSKPGIVAQPVAQRLHRRFEIADAAVLRRHQPRPARQTRGELGSARPFVAIHRGARLDEGCHQAGLGTLGEHRRFDAQRPRQCDHQLAADPPAAVLDQVQVRRRDPHRRRQLRLTHPQIAAPRPDARAHAGLHRRPFCAASKIPLHILRVH